MEQRLTAANGIPIYAYPSSHLHSFCISLYIKSGVLYEGEEESGITHFWEHMEFRNINHLYGGGLYRLLDSLGASMNAATYKEFMQIRITAAPRQFDACAQILSKVFLPFAVKGPQALGREEILTERRRVKSEIREAEERTSLDYFAQTLVWKGTPLEKTILGRHKALDRMGAAALQRAKERFLTPDGAFFYVTGCYTQENLAYLARVCAAPAGSGAGQDNASSDRPVREERRNLAPVPAVFFHRDCQVAIKNADFTLVRFSFDFATDRYSMAELNLLYDALFRGESCSFFQSLSDESGLVYSYDARVEKYRNIGNLYFSYEVQANRLEESLDKTLEVLKRAKEGRMELDCLLPFYIDNAGMLLDDPEELNWSLAYEHHIMETPFTTLEESVESYRRVSAQRLGEVAREIFHPQNALLTVKCSKKRFSPEQLRALVLKGLGES